MEPKEIEIPRQTALFVSAFIDELSRCGVRHVVISPGSRSTPLAVIAHESELETYVDIDERGAAFFALGLAKASRLPVCLVCTSGTAGANYYPAILEAKASRVPLIVLTADRPLQMQNFGAPQTCDQIKMFSDHVHFFQQMPVPSDSSSDIAFARQVALAAFAYAAGSHVSYTGSGDAQYGCWSSAGPTHINFPFTEPLMPDMSAEGLYSIGRAALEAPPYVAASSSTAIDIPIQILDILQTKKTIVVVGEGSIANSLEAEELRAWARAFNLPLLADPLSGMRSYSDSIIIDRFDVAFANELCPEYEAVIRFGRYPISKACFSTLAKKRPIQIVVDACETRDFNFATDVFIRCTPAAFVASCKRQLGTESVRNDGAYLKEWSRTNERASEYVALALQERPDEESAMVAALVEAMPQEGCLFAGNSMTIRYLDVVYGKQNKTISPFGNRALNGIDGTLSTALGVSQCFDHTTVILGDISFLHDINALALNRELSYHHGGSPSTNVVIVVFNNHGGGVFDIVAHKRDSALYDRLFYTRHDLELSSIVEGFGIECRVVATTEELVREYARLRDKAGINVIEVTCLLDGLGDRYASCRDASSCV